MSLSQIYLPLSVSSMANAVFINSGLATITCYSPSYAEQWVSGRNYELIRIPLYADDVTLYLPRGLQEIDTDAFRGIGARRIVIPSGCRTIREKAFAFCPELAVLEIPDSVTDIAGNFLLGSEGVIIIAPKGSSAAYWALAHGITLITR